MIKCWGIIYPKDGDSYVIQATSSKKLPADQDALQQAAEDTLCIEQAKTSV